MSRNNLLGVPRSEIVLLRVHAGSARGPAGTSGTWCRTFASKTWDYGGITWIQDNVLGDSFIIPVAGLYHLHLTDRAGASISSITITNNWPPANGAATSSGANAPLAQLLAYKNNSTSGVSDPVTGFVWLEQGDVLRAIIAPTASPTQVSYECMFTIAKVA